jgi:hypothetical protein
MTLRSRGIVSRCVRPGTLEHFPTLATFLKDESRYILFWRNWVRQNAAEHLRQ